MALRVPNFYLTLGRVFTIAKFGKLGPKKVSPWAVLPNRVAWTLNLLCNFLKRCSKNSQKVTNGKLLWEPQTLRLANLWLLQIRIPPSMNCTRQLWLQGLSRLSFLPNSFTIWFLGTGEGSMTQMWFQQLQAVSISLMETKARLQWIYRYVHRTLSLQQKKVSGTTQVWISWKASWSSKLLAALMLSLGNWRLSLKWTIDISSCKRKEFLWKNYSILETKLLGLCKSKEESKQEMSFKCKEVKKAKDSWLWKNGPRMAKIWDRPTNLLDPILKATLDSEN